MTSPLEPHEVPIKLYRTEDTVTVAAPMPGLDLHDVRAEVTPDGELRLFGEVAPTPGSGLLKERESKHVLIQEWTVGPYRRAVVLPVAVDGTAATMTYGNGVLVVVLPVAARTRPAMVRATPG